MRENQNEDQQFAMTVIKKTLAVVFVVQQVAFNLHQRPEIASKVYSQQTYTSIEYNIIMLRSDYLT